MMKLTLDQLDLYERDGFIVLPNWFSTREISILKADLARILNRDSPSRVLEANQEAVRSVYGIHTESDIFTRLSLHPRLVNPAMQILNSSVYVYQSKINAKVAFGGDKWEWHQDFVFWNEEDGMREPRAVNMAVYLDNVTEFNGPLLVIPQTHKLGIIPTVRLEDDSARARDFKEHYGNKPEWTSSLTATLKYSLAKSVIAGLSERYGMRSTIGPAGSLLLFHSNLVHGSGSNMSANDRAVALVTYNSVDNLPVTQKQSRPGFLSSKERSPIVALADDALY